MLRLSQQTFGQPGGRVKQTQTGQHLTGCKNKTSYCPGAGLKDRQKSHKLMGKGHAGTSDVLAGSAAAGAAGNGAGAGRGGSAPSAAAIMIENRHEFMVVSSNAMLLTLSVQISRYCDSGLSVRQVVA